MTPPQDSNAFAGEEPCFCSSPFTQMCWRNYYAVLFSEHSLFLGGAGECNSRKLPYQPSPATSCPAQRAHKGWYCPSLRAASGCKRRRVWSHLCSTTSFRSRCQALHRCDGQATQLPEGSGMSPLDLRLLPTRASLSTIALGCDGPAWLKGQTGCWATWDQGRFRCAVLGGVAVSHVELIWFLTVSNSSCLGLQCSRRATLWACAVL